MTRKGDDDFTVAVAAPELQPMPIAYDRSVRHNEVVE
jgi:hypothetical protein